jgi:subtilisin family serine protease
MHTTNRTPQLLARLQLLITCLLWTLTPVAALAADAKPKLTRQADLPRFSYRLPGSASQFVESDEATFAPFAAQVRADVDKVLASHEIEDRSTLRQILAAKVDLQELAGDYAGGLQTVDALRALEEKPASRFLSGLTARARLQAALDAGSASGPAYEQAFRKRYQALVAPLPWDVTQDGIRAGYRFSRLNSRAATLADVKTELDPALATSGALDAPQAWALVSARNNLKVGVPLSAARAEVLRDYIAGHAVAKPDIWAAREVTLTASDKLTPVNVGIWDSGIDVAVFPNQLFSDPVATKSGTHGVAFDDVGNPSTDWLYPITAEQRKAYPEYRELVKGFLDLQDGVDSPEATSVQKKFATLSPEQMHEMFELNKVISFYIHGTHCAGIAVRGNPAARLVVARFNDQLPDLPFGPTEAWARQMGTAFQQMADYFRSRNVRVVNMSWTDDVAEIETWLTRTGGGADPVARKRRAAAVFAIWKSSIENAIRSAPDTLFVTAAGNSDSNVEFAEDVPPSLRLPNLISVGAVNQAGDETSFTSHGDAVVVHASGYQVDSFVPGGSRLKLSGTSMAAPNVVNLAAKLFALDPSLTPAKVIDLIRRGASTSDDGRRHLIDETRSVRLLKAAAP